MANRKFARICPYCCCAGHLILHDRLLDLAVDGEDIVLVLKENTLIDVSSAAVSAFSDDEADAEVDLR